MAVDQYNMMSGTDYIDYARESIANYYMEYEGVASKEEAYTLIDQNNDLSAFVKDPSGKTNTNWKDEIYRTAITQNHQVSLNGGNQNTRFYAGFGYNKSDGIVLGSDFQRISGRVNVDQKITDWADFSIKQMVASTTQTVFETRMIRLKGWVQVLRQVSYLLWILQLQYTMQMAHIMKM